MLSISRGYANNVMKVTMVSPHLQLCLHIKENIKKMIKWLRALQSMAQTCSQTICMSFEVLVIWSARPVLL